MYQEFWKHDPFEAVKDDKGDIYARGSQVRHTVCNGDSKTDKNNKNKKWNRKFGWMQAFYPLSSVKMCENTSRYSEQAKEQSDDSMLNL